MGATKPNLHLFHKKILLVSKIKSDNFDGIIGSLRWFVLQAGVNTGVEVWTHHLPEGCLQS